MIKQFYENKQTNIKTCFIVNLVWFTLIAKCKLCDLIRNIINYFEIYFFHSPWLYNLVSETLNSLTARPFLQTKGQCIGPLLLRFFLLHCQHLLKHVLIDCLCQVFVAMEDFCSNMMKLRVVSEGFPIIYVFLAKEKHCPSLQKNGKLKSICKNDQAVSPKTIKRQVQ